MPAITGKGKTAAINEAGVDAEGLLTVKSIVQSALEHEAENGQAYNWSSGTVDVDATDTVLLVKNTSDKELHVETIDIANGSVASEYTVHVPTAAVTPAGTTVTGTNLNTGSSAVAEADAKSDETANSQGNILYTVFLGADSNIVLLTAGLILAKNKSVAVDVVAETSESAVTIQGHYLD